MPRPDRQVDSRAAKVAKIQKAGAAAERRRSGMVWGIAALVLALVVGSVVAGVLLDSPTTADLSAVKDYEYAGQAHQPTPVTYAENPPVGGPHHPAWWDCGVYDQEVPKEHAVHSLEHGAVWLTYRPDLPADQVEVLTELGEQDYMLVSPLAGQEAAVVASSWGHQLTLDEADRRTLQAFVRTYKQGPDTPEPGAACSSGTVTDLVQRG